MDGFLAQLAQFVDTWGPLTISTLAVAGAVATTGHVLLFKRNERSAIGWIGLVWLSPVIGFTFYLLLGINRIRRRAREIRTNLVRYFEDQGVQGITADDLQGSLPEHLRHLSMVARVVDVDSPRRLLPGNALKCLQNGDESYPAMIEAIENARTSVNLMSYIFDNDTWGKKFADALIEAADRGIEVRVLVDAAGAKYSFPNVLRNFRGTAVKSAMFNPASLIPPRILSINLRNHRKVLVIDGDLGFTGGINIRDACVMSENTGYPTRDTHFEVRGPAVSHLQEVFAEDWTFATGERLEGESWFPVLTKAGAVFARGITDGPDEDIDKLRWAIMGAIDSARSSLRILTPYFLPDEAIREALIVATKRGVKVEVVIPRRSNLRYVDWASLGGLEFLLKHNIHVYRTAYEEGFDHSKLFVVDDGYVLLGSANWDPRSLRLNFEFNLECYDEKFGATMSRQIGEVIRDAEVYALEEHHQRSYPTRMLHGAFRLIAPYL